MRNDEMWPLIEFYVSCHNVDSNHIRAYEDFLDRIRVMINTTVQIENVTLKLSNLELVAPYKIVNGEKVDIYPSECTENGETYGSEMYCTITTIVDDVKTKYVRVHIGTLPVMVGSCLCNLRNSNVPPEILEREFKYGLGGYFVNNGTPRYIMFQERSSFNRLMAFDYTNKSKNQKYIKCVEIRNSATNDASTSLICLGIQKDDNIYTNLTYLQDKKYIAALQFYYAMGVTDPQKIIEYIIDSKDPLYPRFKPYLLRMFEHSTQSDYVSEIGNLGRDKLVDVDTHLEKVIKRHFFHHYHSIESKCKYYGYMIYQLVLFLENLITEEDRDHFGKKVLDTEASLFCSVFYASMKKTINEMSENIQKSVKGLNSKIIWPIKETKKMPLTSGFSKALTTNNWGTLEKKDSVSQILKPHNYANAIICLQRCCLQLKSVNKNKKPRMVHGSMYGVISPFDTPEGEKVGYQKILAALTYVSNTIDNTVLLEYLDTHIVSIDNEIPYGYHKIFLDYKWLGSNTLEKCIELYNKLRKYKRTNRINCTTSIVWNDIKRELHIFTDGGRLMRPWLLVENGELIYNHKLLEGLHNFEDLISTGCIEFLDQNELEFSMIATSVEDFNQLSPTERKECNYCDIHPATILGSGDGCITDPSRNQGPRNAFGANMKRQAIGTVGKFDGARTLFYPQRAIVENKLANVLLKYDKCPAGMNVPIAFCPYKGMTIEDGSVVSKAAIEMGLFWTDYCTVHLLEINDSSTETIEIPDPQLCIRYRSSKNHNLNANGIIKKGSIVEENDVLCGKTILVDNESKPKQDDSLIYRESNRAYVKDVKVIERAHAGCVLVKIYLVEIKIPECGNKITPLCAQKTTISEIANVEDMPFCPYPTECPTPLVIYSPLCLPSRMTISLLCEVFLGKYVSSTDYRRISRGKVGKYLHNGFEDLTQFNGTDEEKLLFVMDKLVEMGYRRDGCLEMINGMTGKPIITHIYTGIVHMQVLKHMVSDKINIRSTGNIQPIMRCPTEGRSKKGGTKTGTMEKDCYIANGVPNIVLDRMCLSSSKYNTTVCTICGIIETYNSIKDRRCRSCRKDGVMVNIIMPYSFKVIIQEMMSLGIIMRLLTAPFNTPKMIKNTANAKCT